RLAESLDAKSDRLAAYQAANQTYDFWFSRNVVKKGTVLFHAPEIARAFSVGLKCHLARFEVRCNVTDIICNFASDPFCLFAGKQLFHAHHPVAFVIVQNLFNVHLPYLPHKFATLASENSLLPLCKPKDSLPRCY